MVKKKKKKKKKNLTNLANLSIKLRQMKNSKKIKINIKIAMSVKSKNTVARL